MKSKKQKKNAGKTGEELFGMCTFLLGSHIKALREAEKDAN